MMFTTKIILYYFIK